MTEPQPIPITEIIEALQREGWIAAADALMEVKDWNKRTLMCRVHDGPGETMTAG